MSGLVTELQLASSHVAKIGGETALLLEKIATLSAEVARLKALLEQPGTIDGGGRLYDTSPPATAAPWVGLN